MNREARNARNVDFPGAVEVVLVESGIVESGRCDDAVAGDEAATDGSGSIEVLGGIGWLLF